MSLLVYSHDFLTQRRKMDPYETENIDAYKKSDLFRRFALDNFAAIHKLILERHRVRPSIMQLYKSLIGKIGREALESRLKRLSSARFAPAF